MANKLQFAVHGAAELAERPKVVLGVELRDIALQPLRLLGSQLGGEAVEHPLHVESDVPDVECAHLGELRHRPTVFAHGGHQDRAAYLLVEASVSTGDRDARHQPLEVPLERSRERLVEVIDAEHELAVRRSEDSEIAEMGVTAELRI